MSATCGSRNDPRALAVGQQRPLDAALRACWQQLGISERLVRERRLPLFEEPPELALAESAADGRRHLLTPAAAAAWSAMRAAAAADGIEIHIVSAHRSVERQIEIIGHKLESGQSIDQVLAVSAPPGCSEHHTGRAVDIGTADGRPLELEFADTPAFRWLCEHAARFGFRLSFPAGNRWGYDYEPWHWCFDAAAAAPRPAAE